MLCIETQRAPSRVRTTLQGLQVCLYRVVPWPLKYLILISRIPLISVKDAQMAFKSAALAAAVTSAAAFAPAFPGRGIALRTHGLDSASSDRAARRSLVETKMDMGVANTIAGIPLMYGLMSANEYVTHRYYQHNEVGKLDIYQVCP